MKHPILFLAALVGITACDAQVESRKEAVPSAEAPAPVQAADPLVAAGPAVTVQPDADAGVQQAASVVRVDTLTRQGDQTVKLFGTAGGDPAMNGLYTYLGFYQSPAEGWRSFRLGDVLDYRVLSESAGRIDLEVEESVMNEQTTEISSRKRRIIVAWTAGADGAPPAGVTVTPAR
jgi:hypothetical protein